MYNIKCTCFVKVYLLVCFNLENIDFVLRLRHIIFLFIFAIIYELNYTKIELHKKYMIVSAR